MDNSSVNQNESARNKRKQTTEVPTGTNNTDASMPKPKKQYVTRSDAWKLFTKSKDNPEKVSCNYCPAILGHKPRSGTSVLWTHHSACKGYKAFAESKAQKTLVKSSEGGKLVSVIFDQNACRQATAKMIVLDELPFATVERPGFIHFCEIAVPKFEIPSRSTITRDVVKLYMNEKASLKSLFSKNKQRLCLTTDLWTASTTSISYMVITAHFIDESWCLKRKIISFKPVPDHKGQTIAERLKSCMIEWGIEKIFTITVDNATSNDNAVRHFREKLKYIDDALILGGEFMHLRCCAHILNLIVRDGLEEINSSVNAIRNAVKYLRSSDHRFQSFQMSLGMSRNVTRGSLVLDCNTRWNSTYLMLEAALKFRSTFEIMANEDRPYNAYFLELENKMKRDGPPLDEDWNKASRMKIFLEVFYDSTLAFSASKTVTSSSCYDEICSIEESLVSLSADPDPKVRDMAPPMREKFTKYWDGLANINPVLIVASVFDPRSKMAFPTVCFENMYGKGSSTSIVMKEKVMSLLRKLFETYTRSQSRNTDK